METTITPEKIIALVCWCVLAISFICLMVYINILKSDLKHQKKLTELWQKYYKDAVDTKEIYRNKYLDIVSQAIKYKTTADFKDQIINDFKNKVSYDEMARRYWLKANTIQKALYRWGYKKI